MSHLVTDWCGEHGIKHLLTAPYTSAHNGCAEHLHWTLLDKACAMCFTCNTPAWLWDEFCIMAVLGKQMHGCVTITVDRKRLALFDCTAPMITFRIHIVGLYVFAHINVTPQSFFLRLRLVPCITCIAIIAN